MPRGKVGTAKISSPTKGSPKKATTKSSPKKVSSKTATTKGSPKKVSPKKVSSKKAAKVVSPAGAVKAKSGGMRFNGRTRHRRVLRDNIQGITKPVIARLAHRAGIKRINSYVYEETRGVILLTMRDILKNVVAFAKHENVKTLKVQNLLDALALKGVHIAVGTTKDGKNYVRCKPLEKENRSSNKEEFIFDEIKHQQKNSNCLLIARLNFSRLTREVIQDFIEDVRVSKQFLTLLQVCIEHQITTILQMANLTAIHAGRHAVYPKDIQLVRRMLAVKNLF